MSLIVFSQIGGRVTQVLLAEVREVVGGDVIFGGNLFYSHICGFQVYQYAEFAFGVYPFHNGHAEGFLKLTVERSNRYLRESGKLLCIHIAAKVPEHQLSELEVFARLLSEHIDEVVLMIQSAKHHKEEVSFYLHESEF